MARKTESQAKPGGTTGSAKEQEALAAAKLPDFVPAAVPDGLASLDAGKVQATTPLVGEGASDQFEQDDAEQPMQRVVRVASKPEFFRRAGRVFSRIPVDIRLDDLEEAELELLQGEPMLSVSFGYLGD
ncbi:hypothetical protein QWZ03_18230 [Chitinimonas viridis]|uniref:Mu-like prophage FluMu N-terminal domain-containing protein n=1 Tax=Chitinimonas viridis TaxID=664880 RepID=A0ABT8B8Z0_9NEIS|nr:hypothetical protein [Chitinimonas viridis]MDN3578708.1 hypothetical protein [Chitinimonas viridis]